jgi:hypothetical protein
LGKSSAYYRIDNLRQFASGFGQRIKVVLAGTARFDESTVTQQREMVADGGLALSAEIGTKLGHISFSFTEKHQYL